MKNLPDENFPRTHKNFLADDEAYTVREMGWSGKTNGELLDLIDLGSFDILNTADKNHRVQQPMPEYKVAVVLIRASDNHLQTVNQSPPEILPTVDHGQPGNFMSSRVCKYKDHGTQATVQHH